MKYPTNTTTDELKRAYDNWQAWETAWILTREQAKLSQEAYNTLRLAERAARAEEDLSQKSYSYEDLANFTHAEQVKVFHWCGCEDNEGGENPYDDCPKEAA